MSGETGTHYDIHALYSGHHAWLFGWLRRKLGNPFDAADLAQDVFERLLHRQPDAVQAPRPYLSTIARGLVIDHWRRRELEVAWLETLAALPEPQVPSPEDRLVMFETLVAIDRILDGLKPKVRTAFLLARLEGLTCRDIAARLGVSLATAERYVAAGLRHCYALRFR